MIELGWPEAVAITAAVVSFASMMGAGWPRLFTYTKNDHYHYPNPKEKKDA